MSKISIIIPVYNVENYLKQCVNSIISQTIEDIELILIDDGSTDHSGKICDEYAQKDCRIIVIHKSNEGLSAARNDGLKMASSPYVMFVDSDDWVELDFCNKPYKIAVENSADIVLFTYNKVYNDGRISTMLSTISTGFLTEAEAIKFNVLFAPAVWLGLYRKEIFDSVHFDYGKLHEDIGTSHRLIHQAKRIYMYNKALYNYRFGREGSINTDPTTRENLDYREMLVKRIRDLNDWGYEEYAQMYSCRMLIRYGWNDNQLKLPDEVIDIIKRRIPDLLSKKQKVMFRIFRISPSLFDAICMVTRRRVKC